MFHPDASRNRKWQRSFTFFFSYVLVGRVNESLFNILFTFLINAFFEAHSRCFFYIDKTAPIVRGGYKTASPNEKLTLNHSKITFEQKVGWFSSGTTKNYEWRK